MASSIIRRKKPTHPDLFESAAEKSERKRKRANERANARYAKLTSVEKAAILLRQKEWRRNNPEKCKKWKSDWVAKNPEKHRIIRRNNERNKRLRPNGKINKRVREAMGEWFKKKGKTKGIIGKFKSRFGYSTDELRNHLERQFKAGMTWKNYGKKWHIDHIIPLALFKFESVDDPEFKAAWALTNLRPLWAKDNIKKGAKRTHLL